ncbi:MAG TPA: hypothetical protein VGO03_11590 [Acidimicrobiia bacterium]
MTASTSSELVDRWNGTTWTMDTTPGQAGLNAVGCNAVSTCTATAGYGPPVIQRSS